MLSRRCRSATARLLRPVALTSGLLLLAACETTVEVAVVIDEDGSGVVGVEVILDAEASAALGGPDKLAVDDVDQSGWELTEPEVQDDGGFAIGASRPFNDEAELTEVLAEVAGDDAFTSVSSEVEESLGRTTHSASLDLAVSGDPAQFSDEALTGLLDGLPLGRTPEELAAVGSGEPGAGTLTVSIEVPGGEPDSIEMDLTSGAAQQASLSSENTEYRPVVLGAAAAGILLLASGLVVGVLALLRRRRR